MFSTNPTNSWCMDSSCTNHICNTLQGFQETKKLNEGELFLTLAAGSRIPVVAIGVFNLYFSSRVLILKDCLNVPNVRRNLISATYLGKHGYCIILKDNVVIKNNKVFIFFGNIVDGLYILTLDKHELYNFELDNNSHVKSLKRKFPSTNNAYLWHLCLGHINSNRIQRLIKDGLLKPLDFDGFQFVNLVWRAKCSNDILMQKVEKPKSCLNQFIQMYVVLCQPKQMEAMSTSSLLWMITQDMVMCT